MFYQVKVKYDKIAENGKQVVETEDYLVNNCVLHAEAEAKLLQYGIDYSFENFDVTAVKRSKIREFVNDCEDDNDIYVSTIVDVFIDENTGKEKETKYQVGVYATSVDDATKKTNEYMRQGLNDCHLVCVKKTKIVEVLEY